MPPVGPITAIRPSLLERVTAVVPGVTQRRNKAAVLKMMDAFNNPNPAVVPKLLHPQYREHASYPLDKELERMPNEQRIQQEIKLVHEAFPDKKYTVKELVAEGDTVVLIWEFTGTHKGEFFGRPATGRRLNVTGYEVVKFKNGRMIGHIDNHPQTIIDVLGQTGMLDRETLAELGMPQG